MRFFKTVCFLSFLALILAPMVGLRASETVVEQSPGEICKAYATEYKGIALKRDQGVTATQILNRIADIAQGGMMDGTTAGMYVRMVVDVYGNPEKEPQDFYDAAWKQCATHYGIVQS